MQSPPIRDRIRPQEEPDPDATPDLTREPRDPVRPEAIAPALFAHFVVRTSNFEAMRA
jgi:hypothetical protein